MAMIKTLLQEVAITMGKSEVDDEVVDKASDILKMLKVQEILSHGSTGMFRTYGTNLLAKYKEDGTQALYDKVLSGRRGNGQQI